MDNTSGLIGTERERAARRAYLFVGFGVAAYEIISTVVLFLLDRFVFPALGIDVSTDYTQLFTMIRMFLPMYLIALPLSVPIFMCAESHPIEKTKLKLSKLIQFIFIAYFVMFAGNIVGVITRIISVLFFRVDSTGAANELILSGNPIYTFIFSVLLAPVVEEFVFRKLIIDRVHVYGGGVAVFMSALIFGLIHGNIAQMFGAFAIGLVLGYVYLKTGKMLYTVIIHALVNLIANVAGLLLRQLTSVIDGPDYDLPKLLMVMAFYLLFTLAVNGLVAGGIVFFVKNVKKVSFAEEECALPASKGFKSAFVNAGMITLLVVCLVMIVRSIVPVTDIFSSFNLS